MADRTIIAAYVQASDGKPLMPCHSHGRVKRMLKSGRARIVMTYPFTIRLNYEPKTRITQSVFLGEKPGRDNIGLTAALEDGTVLYGAHLETRNQEVKRNMQKRAGCRRTRRNNRRVRRRRRSRSRGMTFCMKFRATGMGMRPHAILKKRRNYPLRDQVQGMYHILTEDSFRYVWMRFLPSYTKPVILHDIINTKARFSNRKRKKGWLTPTARHLLDTCMNAVRLVKKILPVTDIVLQIGKYDIAKMDHPDWRGDDYCKGPLYGYPGRNRKEKLHAAVDSLQNSHCIFCQKSIVHYHHIIPVTRGGRDVVSNIAGVCETHHDRLHKDRALYNKMAVKKENLNKKNGLLSVLNQIMPYLQEELEKLPDASIHCTDGKTTKEIREHFQLPKGHYTDAWCVAVSSLDPAGVNPPEFSRDNTFHVMQFRRHDRAYIKRLESKKYLDADNRVVAVNRKKATVAVPKKDCTTEEKKQTGDSLAEYREKLVNQYLEGITEPSDADRMEAIQEAERIISRLRVSRGHAVYNDMGRIMPGAVYRVKDTGELIVMRGQHNHGERIYQAYAGMKPLKSHVRLLKKNAGILKREGNSGNAEYLSLLDRVKAAEDSYPEDKDIPVSCLELVKHNSGLVYVPQSITFPA